MAYKKSYRKKYNRSSNKKRVLKKSQIFSKKSAKSQAKQIYYLNKKINYVNKKVSPEIDTMTTDIIYKTENFNNKPLKYSNGRIALFRGYLNNSRDSDSHFYFSIDDNVDIIKVKNICLYGDFGFSEYNSVSGQYAVIPNSDITAQSPHVAYMRFIVCQTFSGGDDFPTRLTTDIVKDSEDSAFVDTTLINGPLIRGLKKRFKVLKQKIIKITPTNPRKLYKIYIPGFTYKKVNGSYKSGEIFIYYQYVCPAMLQYTDTTVIPNITTKISPEVHWSMNCKISWNRTPGVEMVIPSDVPVWNPNVEPND